VEKLSLRKRLQLVAEILSAFREVWDIRHGREVSLPLPIQIESNQTSHGHADAIAGYIDCLVLLFLFWKRARCLYRCHALATVLRRRGVPVILNIGCRQRADKSKNLVGHCWLTLNGNLFAESKDPRGLYPIAMCDKPALIQFWFGSDG